MRRGGERGLPPIPPSRGVVVAPTYKACSAMANNNNGKYAALRDKPSVQMDEAIRPIAGLGYKPSLRNVGPSAVSHSQDEKVFQHWLGPINTPA